MQTEPIGPRRVLQFGIYRDGDNNLDEVQESAVTQAVGVSRRDARVAFTVEDTGSQASGTIATRDFALAGGRITHESIGEAKEMSDPKTLAAFVARTLDEAECNGTAQTWIELVDHGGGDGGGLETSDGHVMAMPQIAQAIADGIATHAREHPEDAGRGIDGVVANQCLMATMGFADALSRAGVKYLAASPETMVAPGVPASVSEAIAKHEDDPRAMARAVVGDVMRTRYDAFPFGELSTAAAFDVIDCAPDRLRTAERAIARLNDDIVADAADRARIRGDVNAVDGMARIPHGDALPWRADRPAIAVYRRLASDGQLPQNIRADARAAAGAVGATVLAHAESAHFGPFGGVSYRDAAGPTVHLPTSRREVDPWAPRVSETGNAFYRAVDGAALTRALA